MPNLEMAGVAVSASNPIPFAEVVNPAAGTATINRRLIAAATGLGAASAVAMASNGGRQGGFFFNTSAANAYLAGAGQLPSYSASETNAIWDYKIAPGQGLIMDRDLLIPGTISVTFDGAPGGYLRSAEVSS